MADIPVEKVSDLEWADLVRRYGDGKSPHIGSYERLKPGKYPGGTISIAPRWKRQTAQSGFLQVGGVVKGRVSGIPKSALD